MISAPPPPPSCSMSCHRRTVTLVTVVEATALSFNPCPKKTHNLGRDRVCAPGRKSAVCAPMLPEDLLSRLRASFGAASRLAPLMPELAAESAPPRRFATVLALVLGVSQRDSADVRGWMKLEFVMLDAMPVPGFGVDSFDASGRRASATAVCRVDRSTRSVVFNVPALEGKRFCGASGHELVLAPGMRCSLFAADAYTGRLFRTGSAPVPLNSIALLEIGCRGCTSEPSLGRHLTVHDVVGSCPAAFSDELWRLLPLPQSLEESKHREHQHVRRLRSPGAGPEQRAEDARYFPGPHACKQVVSKLVFCGSSGGAKQNRLVRVNNSARTMEIAPTRGACDREGCTRCELDPSSALFRFLMDVDCIGALMTDRNARFFVLLEKFWALAEQSNAPLPPEILAQMRGNVDACVGFRLTNLHWVVVDPFPRAFRCTDPADHGIVAPHRLQQGYTLCLFSGDTLLDVYGLPSEQLYDTARPLKRRRVREAMRCLRPVCWEPCEAV